MLLVVVVHYIHKLLKPTQRVEFEAVLVVPELNKFIPDVLRAVAETVDERSLHCWMWAVLLVAVIQIDHQVVKQTS